MKSGCKTPSASRLRQAVNSSPLLDSIVPTPKRTHNADLSVPIRVIRVIRGGCLAALRREDAATSSATAVGYGSLFVIHTLLIPTDSAAESSATSSLG